MEFPDYYRIGLNSTIGKFFLHNRPGGSVHASVGL
jgi:hypothetical protein